jgi:signal transduction histidine kinase
VWPRQTPSTERHITVPVVHQGEDIGEIDLDGAPPDVEQRSRDILQAVAGPAAVALSTVRLTLALRRRATELMDINDALERSRQRLVDARFEQRRHFRGELEQRVLPPLDAARAAVTAAGGTGRPVDLAPAGAAVASALEALREISRGVYPPRMADAGLVTALRSWRNGAATVVTAGDLDRLHRDPAAEAGAFFAVVSWLQAAHPGSAGPVRVAVDDDRVRFEVSGDVEAGILDEVVEAMRDRTGAFGGELEVQRTVMPMVVSGWLPFAADSRPGRSVPTAPSGELQW